MVFVPLEVVTVSTVYYLWNTINFFSRYQWSISVVFNHCSESLMRLPSTLCAALSSLLKKRPLFCAADFFLL